MSKHAVIDPLVALSVAELIACYIGDGLPIRPDTSGLPDFAVASLHDNGIGRVGDDAYCLYKKSYRCAGTPAGVVVKVYVESGVARSNGIDVWSGQPIGNLPARPRAADGAGGDPYHGTRGIRRQARRFPAD